MDHLAMSTKYHDPCTAFHYSVITTLSISIKAPYIMCYSTYEDSYLHFGCNLLDDKNLIKNSVRYKIHFKCSKT